MRNAAFSCPTRYVYMHNVYDAFLTQYGSYYEVRLQEPGLSELDRTAVLAEFEQPRDRSFLYFMVLGGVFAEGIDLKGDRLIGSAIRRASRSTQASCPRLSARAWRNAGPNTTARIRG